MEKQGVFYAVSVGPGDPELLTRQACRVLEVCDVIVAPRTKAGRMLALDIAAGAVDIKNKTILPLDFTMERSETVREDSYRTAAAAIETALNALVSLCDVLGLMIKKAGELPADIQALADARVQARKDRDWKKSDELRDQLKALGYIVEDTKEGQKVRKAV